MADSGTWLMMWLVGVVVVSNGAPITEGKCVSPGRCIPPDYSFKRVAVGPTPSRQWEISGGFCGAWSLQQSGLAHGAWLSQDLVRKANKDWPGPHVMHGDSALGYEVVPINIGYTCKALKLNCHEWDYNATKPQVSNPDTALIATVTRIICIIWEQTLTPTPTQRRRPLNNGSRVISSVVTLSSGSPCAKATTVTAATAPTRRPAPTVEDWTTSSQYTASSATIPSTTLVSTTMTGLSTPRIRTMSHTIGLSAH